MSLAENIQNQSRTMTEIDYLEKEGERYLENSEEVKNCLK